MFLLWVLPAILFFPSLFYYFVQDDFYLLLISQAKTLNEFFLFFIPLADTVWYRPLSSQVFFFVSQLIFGANPFPFHLIVLVTHLLTIWFLYKLLVAFNIAKISAKIGALFYGMHQIHTVSLSWLSAYSFILGPMFLVLFFYTVHKKKYFVSGLYFLLGLLTTEVFVVALPMLYLYERLLQQKTSKLIWVFCTLVTILLFSLRFILFPTQQSTDLYAISLGNNLFASLKFYLFRMIGVPLGFTSLPEAQKSMVVMFILIIVIMFFLGSKRIWNQSTQRPRLKFFLLWNLVGLFPFLILPNHQAPHYASFALLGLAGLFSMVMSPNINHFRPKLTFAIIVVLLFVSNLLGVQRTYATHWIFSRARLAEKLVESNHLVHWVGSEEYFSLGADAAYEYFKTH
ncbi:hypothetical protein C4564_00750 [Candidatus Microgenomates bacterium]|nr:MAG: hypothetical protein C4564_00750 [Candidatus Microgenomates bacterium]